MGFPYTITGTGTPPVKFIYKERESSSEKLVNALFLTIFGVWTYWIWFRIWIWIRMRIRIRISNAGFGSIPTQNNDFTLKTVPLKGWVNYLDIDLVGDAAPGTEGPYVGEVMLTRPGTNQNIEAKEGR